jgi:hypothetical protein
MEACAAFVAIDWSDTKHDICLVDGATGKKESFLLKHAPEALDAWAAALRRRFGGRPIAIGLEQSRGSLIYALLKYDFCVLYPIHPTTLAEYREAFSPSRAKDDPRDAAYRLERLVHHRDRLKSVFENSLLHARNTSMAHADHPCSCPALLLPSLPCVSAPAPREVQPVAQQRPTEKRRPHAMLAGVRIHLVSM